MNVFCLAVVRFLWHYVFHVVITAAVAKKPPTAPYVRHRCAGPKGKRKEYCNIYCAFKSQLGYVVRYHPPGVVTDTPLGDRTV